MGRSLIFLFCVSICFSVFAQMTDLLGNLAIQGQMTAQSVKGYNTANLMNQKNNLAQELQIQVIEIKTKFLNNKNNVSHETINSPVLRKYNTKVQRLEDFIVFELHQVEENLCKSLKNNFAESYKIDNSNCQNLKIYYK